MTQPSRTTETINRDNAAIRDIMHRTRELTVPDRATLALGLIGHLATLMNRSQMATLLKQLQEEAERVQDVPPSRYDSRPPEERASVAHAGGRADGDARRDEKAGGRGSRATSADLPRTKPHGDVLGEQVERSSRQRGEGVGQAGRGEFRSGRLL
jgi:hypothetical protein